MTKPVNPLIINRYSPVIFSDKAISEELVNKLIESAKWAPSSFNEQPWRFIIGHKGYENYKVILESLMEGNQVWAKETPLLMVILSKKTYSKSSKPNRFADYEAGMAIGNLLIQATEENLFAHQMGGFSTNKLKTNFNISDELNIISVIAIGYKGDKLNTNENLIERENKPRTRHENDFFIIQVDSK